MKRFYVGVKNRNESSKQLVKSFLLYVIIYRFYMILHTHYILPLHHSTLHCSVLCHMTYIIIHRTYTTYACYESYARWIIAIICYNYETMAATYFSSTFRDHAPTFDCFAATNVTLSWLCKSMTQCFFLFSRSKPLWCQRKVELKVVTYCIWPKWPSLTIITGCYKWVILSNFDWNKHCKLIQN